MNGLHWYLAASVVLAATAAAACDTAPYVEDDVASLSGHQHRSDAGADADDDDDTSGKKTTKTTTDATPLPVPTGGQLPNAAGDAGASSAGATDPWAGAPAFAVITPKFDTTSVHSGGSNQGQDCLQCHNGDNTAPVFELAGTVRKTGGQPAGATGVEVRIVGPDGTEVALLGTDSQGSFWKAGNTPIPAGSHVGVRDGTTTKKMSGSIGAGSCNTDGCHNSDRPIFLNAAQ